MSDGFSSGRHVARGSRSCDFRCVWVVALGLVSGGSGGSGGGGSDVARGPTTDSSGLGRAAASGPIPGDFGDLDLSNFVNSEFVAVANDPSSGGSGCSVAVAGGTAFWGSNRGVYAIELSAVESVRNPLVATRRSAAGGPGCGRAATSGPISDGSGGGGRSTIAS